MHYNPGGAPRPVLSPVKSRLVGTGRIADELYLIAHHEVTGRSCLSPRSLGVAMAGGLLADLMAPEAPAVTLQRGYVLPLYGRKREPVARHARPDEPVAGHVLDVIMSESAPRPVRDWLLFLGKTAAVDVARRLERSGYLAQQPSRLPWRLPPPTPVNADWSHCALLRAHAALEAAKVLTPYSALLAGLALACGLGFRFSDFRSAPRRTAEEATRILSRPLQELIAEVQVTVDSTVLSTRK
jgi:hypothetical protein